MSSFDIFLSYVIFLTKETTSDSTQKKFEYCWQQYWNNSENWGHLVEFRIRSKVEISYNYVHFWRGIEIMLKLGWSCIHNRSETKVETDRKEIETCMIHTFENQMLDPPSLIKNWWNIGKIKNITKILPFKGIWHNLEIDVKKPPRYRFIPFSRKWISINSFLSYIESETFVIYPWDELTFIFYLLSSRT